MNIIANIIKRGQTVAVVSNNNAATDNVYEKLEKYNLNYLCARLGKKENKEDFINNQTVEYDELETKSLWFRLKAQYIYGIGNKKFYKKPKNDIVRYYNKIFFIVKEMELSNKIKEKEKRLRELGTNKLELLTSYSIKLLNEYLRQRYKEQTKRKVFDIKELYTNSKEFNKEYPIVFSTTYSMY